MSTNKKHFRSGLILTSENIISGVIKFLFSVLIVKKFGASSQGEFAYLNTIASYFTIFSISIIDQTNIVTVPKIKNEIHKLQTYFGTAIFSAIAFIALASAILIAIIHFNILQKVPFPILLIVAYASLFALRQTIRSLLLGIEKYYIHSIVNIAVEVLLLVSLYLCKTFDRYLIIGLMIFCIPIIVFSFEIFKKSKWQIKFRTIELKNILKYGSKMFINVILQTILFRIDVFFIIYMYDAKKLSYYVICTVFAELIILPSKSITIIILNKTIHDESSFTNQSFRIVSTLILFIGMGIMISGSTFIPIIYGAEYSAQLSVFWIQCIGAMVVANIYIYSYFLLGKGFNKIILLANSISVLPGLVMYYFLSKYFGILGTSIASTISYTIIFLVLIIWMKKNIPIFNKLNYLLPTSQTIIFLRNKFKLSRKT